MSRYILLSSDSESNSDSEYYSDLESNNYIPTTPTTTTTTTNTTTIEKEIDKEIDKEIESEITPINQPPNRPQTLDDYFKLFNLNDRQTLLSYIILCKTCEKFTQENMDKFVCPDDYCNHTNIIYNKRKIREILTYIGKYINKPVFLNYNGTTLNGEEQEYSIYSYEKNPVLKTHLFGSDTFVDEYILIKKFRLKFPFNYNNYKQSSSSCIIS